VEEVPLLWPFGKKTTWLAVAAAVVLAVVSFAVTYGGILVFLVKPSGWGFPAALLVFGGMLWWVKGKQHKTKPEKYKLLG
jgi:hypothetical protein